MGSRVIHMCRGRLLRHTGNLPGGRGVSFSALSPQQQQAGSLTHRACLIKGARSFPLRRSY